MIILDDLPEVETITPYEAAKKLHKNAEWVRAGLRQGKFPFGIAVQSKSGQFNYIIYKKKFCQYVRENN